MPIVTINDPDHQVLKQPAQAVAFPLNDEIKNCIQEMIDMINALESPYGKPAGLAGPQMGFPWRIILIQIPPEAKARRKDVYDEIPLTTLLNPSYTPVLELGMNKDWEGCYSVPDKMGEVYRYNVIEYQGYTREGALMQGRASGFLARLLQHEIGHINGQLYTDLIGPDCRFGSTEEMMPVRIREMTGGG